MNFKKFLAVFIVSLFLVSGLAILADNSASSHPQANPALSSIGETGSTSTGVNYYTENSASDVTGSGSVSAQQNSTYYSECISADSWTINSAETSECISFSLPSNYYYQDVGVGLTSNDYLYFSIGDYQIYQFNYTISVGSYSYTSTGNTPGNSPVANPEYFYLSAYAEPSHPVYGSPTISLTVDAVSGEHFTNVFGVLQGTTDSSSIYTAFYDSSGSATSVDYGTGYHFSTSSVTLNPGTNPASYDISWSSPVSFSVTYNSATQTGTSGSYTASLSASPSLSFTTNGDPETTDSTLTLDYTLSSIELVSTNSTTQTSSPSYTFSQVSGTTNQASASFSFAGSTPSSAFFGDYRDSSGSVVSTSISFQPTIGVTNPYYSYAQNDLVASLSGASSGSSNTSSTQNPSFTGGTASYTSSSTPSWTVDLNLYGNRHPVYVNSAISQKTVNPLTPITLYANYSEYFPGEAQYLQSSWNGHALTSASSTLDQLSQSSYFHSTGNKTITFYANNTPDPTSNGLSSLDSGSNSYSVSVLPFSLTPSPVDYSSVGTSVPLSLAYSTQTTALMTQINLTVNGVLEDRFQPDSSSGTVKYTFSQPTSSPLLVTWQATDQYGYSQSITFQYGSNLTPAEYSNKVTVLQSPNATHSYPISLSGVPSGTGYYQQLLTINDPSQYGINSKGSNIQFASSNGTLLYAWIQSINSTSMQVWVKNYNDSSVIDMQVFPSFENLFSANGYLSNKSFEVFPIQISGSAGFSSTLPTGSPAGSIGIYANSSKGDYVNLSAKDYGAGTNITFYVWSNGLGDLFFDANSAGTGQALRFDTRGNYFDSQFHSTGSWTSWNVPPSNSYTPSSSTWYEGIVHFNANGTVIGYWSYATQNAYGQNATSYYTVSHDGNYIGFIGDGVGSSYVTYWNGLAINGTQVFEIPSSMPTYSIGSGSVFQANATTSSTFSGAPGQQYNSTYQYFTYDIPLSPSTDYVTVIWNSTWQLSNAYPATYLPVSSNFITFEDLSGFGSIEVQLIEPSSQINQMEQVQISPYQKATNDSLGIYDSYFSLSVSYTPFGSSKTYTITPSSMSFELPFGATATAHLYDSWHHLIGTQQFNVTSDYNDIPVSANVTSVSLIDSQTSGSFSGEIISSNGYNASFPDPMVVGSGYKYSYSVSAINPQNYEMDNYPGFFTANGTSQVVSIDVGMPLASALVNVYAYNQSGLGLLGNAGPATGSATAYLYINGVRQSLSSTFSGELGMTYPVKITDVLGNVLYSGNLTLNQPSQTVDIHITNPSYAVQFINDENVPASSPQATQFSSINPLNGSGYYNFTTRVGQESTIYLATGSYHLFTHDNLTNSVNFTITNETIGFVFNGPNIISETKTAIEDTNHGINFNVISQPGTLIAGQNATWLLEPVFKNGTILSTTELEGSSFQFLVANSSGSFLPETISHTIVDGYLEIRFQPTVNGTMTLAMKESYGNNSGSYSDTISITPITPVSHGLKAAITVPGTIQVKNGTAGTILYSLTASNSTSPITPDQKETEGLIINTTAELIYKGDYVSSLTIYYVQPGEAGFALNISQTGTGYQILVITKPTDISGQNVSYTGTSQSFTVSSANPANPQTGWDQFQKIITGVDAQILYLIVTILTVLYYGYKYIRRREIELEKEENQAGLMLEADVLHDGLIYKIENKPMPPELAAIFDAIPASRRNKIFGMITSRRKIKFPVPKFLQKKNMSGGKK